MKDDPRYLPPAHLLPAANMTLLDYFAAAALQALLTRIDMSGEEQALKAYKIAFAAIKQRPN